MTELGPIIGVSTTLISAACKEHCVPTPPRGYWSKVRAGKPTPKTPLPARPPGMSNSIRIGRPKSGKISSPPEFVMSIEELRAQVLSAVRISQRIQKTQRSPINRIQRIWHALSNALGNFGGVITPKVNEPASATIQIYHQSVFVSIEVCDVPEEEQLSRHTCSSLTLSMRKQHGTKEPLRIWQDAQGDALEAKLQEITAEIVVLAEVKERDAQTASYEWQVARRNQDRTNQLESELRRQEDIETQSAVRVSSLLDLAKQHEQANTLRSLLAEVDAIHPSAVDLEIQRWRSMVAAEIERLDPLNDKRFLIALGANPHASEAA